MPYQPEAKPAQAVSEPLPARRGQEPTPYQADLRTLGHAAATTVRRSYSAIGVPFRLTAGTIQEDKRCRLRH
jgi:hypothetical protein